MNSKEKKIDIEVKVAGVRISPIVPFSMQNEVRRTEAEIKIFLDEQRDKHPGRGQSELLAMATYHFASKYYALLRQREEELGSVEDLLEEAGRLCGDSEDYFPEDSTDSFFGY